MGQKNSLAKEKLGSKHEKDETSVDLQRPFDLVYLV